MGGVRTGDSSSYGGTNPALRASANDSPVLPGLVLLYARNYEQFAPAYPFTKPAVIIGRDAGADVCVPEQAVSRYHARITRQAERWVLSDLGSRNGTMVDGAFITSDVDLEHLHEIRVGDAIFKFVAAAADQYAGYHIDGRTFGAAATRAPRAITALVGGWQMSHIADELERIAPTQLSCVILGETGTGKEVAARELHRVSGRRGSLQAINCTAIPHNLLESELFGYRRGAFSGADRDKPGLITLANGGTLFLDEIGDMPLDAQAKLLRVLQSREVFPLGATAPERVDVRVVCATHRNLQKDVKEGKFRGDLFARVSEHLVALPPLRERKEDILRLAQLFAARYADGRSAASPRPGQNLGTSAALTFSFSFMVALLHYDWPFNVRELESCVKRAVVLAEGQTIDSAQLPDAIAALMREYGQPPPTTLRANNPPASFTPPPPLVATSPVRRAPPTEDELRGMLARHRGNVAAVGRELGKERMQVHRWMKRYGISIEDYR
jgi:transcriptional regulator with GAF, ATPase, and Fis domain